MEFFEDSVLEDYILKADIATQIETQVEEDKILEHNTEKLH